MKIEEKRGDFLHMSVFELVMGILHYFVIWCCDYIGCDIMFQYLRDMTLVSKDQLKAVVTVCQNIIYEKYTKLQETPRGQVSSLSLCYCVALPSCLSPKILFSCVLSFNTYWLSLSLPPNP